ncbi:hypothetical protein PMAYCL1PPCAC_23765, partial [Pristionchus mayeri]
VSRWSLVLPNRNFFLLLHSSCSQCSLPRPGHSNSFRQLDRTIISLPSPLISVQHRLLSRNESLDRKVVYKPCALYFIESFLSSLVHSQLRTGQLFTMRVFDFCCSFVLLFSIREKGEEKSSISTSHLMLLSLAASFSWFEWGQMEYTPLSIIASPFLQIVKAQRILSTKEAFSQSRLSIEGFSVEYCRLNCLSLLIPAIVSFLWRDVQITASWESIDYTLLYLSPLWFSVSLFSALWQITQLSIHQYILSEHTRLTLASAGQWILQNMAHPSLFALSAKITFVATIMRNGRKIMNWKREGW